MQNLTESKWNSDLRPTISIGWPEEVNKLEGYNLILEGILQEIKDKTPIQFFSSDHFHISTQQLLVINKEVGESRDLKLADFYTFL